MGRPEVIRSSMRELLRLIRRLPEEKMGVALQEVCLWVVPLLAFNMIAHSQRLDDLFLRAEALALLVGDAGTHDHSAEPGREQRGEGDRASQGEACHQLATTRHATHARREAERLS
jgi:hypothetical protein